MSSLPPNHFGLPQISIITPCRNAVGHLARAIESVRHQRGVRVEHIVIDGASQDGTQDILRNDPDVRWVSEPDEGQSDAFNKGLALARAPIIGWLNADDCYEPDVLAHVVAYFDEHADAAIVNGHLVRVDEQGNTLEFLPASSNRFWLVHFWFRWYGLNHPSTFYRREVFDRVGGVDTSMHYAMDYDFYLRASRVYQFHDIDVLTTQMLVHAEAKTSQGYDNFASDVRRTLAKVWKPRSRLFYGYTLLALRAFTARTHLVEALVALRGGNRSRAWSEMAAAVSWWPPLFVLPAFYGFLARAGLRLLLGESRYSRLPRFTHAVSGGTGPKRT